MPHDNNNSNMTNAANTRIIPQVQSQNGLYFIGQTPILTGTSGSALATLFNPCNCGRLLYLSVATITNTSSQPVYAEFYLNSYLQNLSFSTLVSSTNTAICPAVCPCGQVLYATDPISLPVSGTAIFSRVVAPYSTEVIDGSNIILGQGQFFTVLLGGTTLPVAANTVRVAFGWSEVPVYYGSNEPNNGSAHGENNGHGGPR